MVEELIYRLLFRRLVHALSLGGSYYVGVVDGFSGGERKSCWRFASATSYRSSSLLNCYPGKVRRRSEQVPSTLFLNSFELNALFVSFSCKIDLQEAYTRWDVEECQRRHDIAIKWSLPLLYWSPHKRRDFAMFGIKAWTWKVPSTVNCRNCRVIIRPNYRQTVPPPVGSVWGQNPRLFECM